MAKNKAPVVSPPELDPALAALIGSQAPVETQPEVTPEPEAPVEEAPVEPEASPIAGVRADLLIVDEVEDAVEEVSEEVPANVSLLVWPQDQYGITATLKPALIEAAGRMNGDEEKLQTLLGTLAYGKGHILARFVSQAEDRAATLRDYAEAEARRNAQNSQHG